MKTPTHNLRAGLTMAMLLGLTAGAAETVATLKDNFKDYFPVGTAINSSIATGTAGFRRTGEQLNNDIALVKEQFNQITAENEMKWMSIHPRAGKDGYDWAASDAFVKFGTENHMELAGHTLVWHSQTPNWVFEGTRLPPGISPESKPAGEENTATPTAPGRGPEGGGFGGAAGFRGFNLNGPRASREECGSISAASWVAIKAKLRYGML